MSKILLIDWNSIVKSDKLIRFPVSISLVKELFGDHAGVWENKEFQEKYENNLITLFQNMRESGIEFFSPGGSPLRRLISMLWWFYIKKNNPPECSTRYFVDEYKEHEDTYNLDPELFEYLYDEYYQYFKDNYIFEVFNEVQRLVDRKPDDWELGVFSTDLAEGELDIILDKLKSVKSYGDVFKLRFGTNGLVSAYAQDIVHPNEVIAKSVNKFKQNRSNVFLLYQSPVEMKYFASDIRHILLGKEDSMDRFDFDNPGVLLEVSDAYRAEKELDEESRIKPIAGQGVKVSSDFWTTSDNDDEIIKGLGKSGLKPEHIVMFVFLLFTVVMMGSAVSDYLEKVYKVSDGHWFSVISVMLLGGGFCSFIPVLIYSVSEIKTSKVMGMILFGFFGGILATILTGFEHMRDGITGVFAISAFMSSFYVLEYNKDMKERIFRYVESTRID